MLLNEVNAPHINTACTVSLFLSVCECLYQSIQGLCTVSRVPLYVHDTDNGSWMVAPRSHKYRPLLPEGPHDARTSFCPFPIDRPALPCKIARPHFRNTLCPNLRWPYHLKIGIWLPIKYKTPPSPFFREHVIHWIRILKVTRPDSFISYSLVASLIVFPCGMRTDLSR